MLINLTNIFSDEQQSVKIEKTINLDKIEFNKEVAKVSGGVFISLELEKISNNEILLTGDIKTTLVLKCDRCNEAVEYPIETHFSKEVDITALSQESEDDFIEGYNLDLRKLAENEIYLNFPMKVLCSEDCLGVCPKCGINLNLYSCNCEVDNIDPRLAGLKDLFNEKFKEV